VAKFVGHLEELSKVAPTAPAPEIHEMDANDVVLEVTEGKPIE